MKSNFQNRDAELQRLLDPTASLITVYGEAGIGKTRLLSEAIHRLESEFPSSLVFWVDTSQLPEESSEAQEDLLRLLIKQAKGQLSGVWTSMNEVATEIVNQITTTATREPVVLVFDNTESLQENGDFWHWLELQLVGPLLAGDRVKLIFAGRIPQPWRRFEVRQALTLLPLRPLDLEVASNALIVDVLSEYNQDMGPEEQRSAARLVNDLAFGHPHLSEKIAAYIASRWPPADLSAFRVEICREVVKPFIENVFFANVAPPWNKWLWLMSVLDWFDTTILPAYLKRLTPDEVMEKPDYYFIQEIGRLRVEKRILWREERGDCMHGLIGEIVERCLKILEPESYYKANIAAAETFKAIAEQFEDDPDIRKQYESQADFYAQRADKA